MKKITITIVSVLMLAAAAFCMGCGKKPETPPAQYVPAPGSLDVAALAKSIREGCKFDDAGLVESPNPEFAFCTVYGADAALVAGDEGAKKVAVYNSSASPEMIIVAEAADADSARQLMEGAIESLVQTYITDYSNYGPEEVSKLTSACKEQRGTYVILAVTADNAAAGELINGLLSAAQ